MYKGFWRENQKNGYGAAYDGDGRIFMLGMWVMDRICGNYITVHERKKNFFDAPEECWIKVFGRGCVGGGVVVNLKAGGKGEGGGDGDGGEIDFNKILENVTDTMINICEDPVIHGQFMRSISDNFIRIYGVERGENMVGRKRSCELKTLMEMPCAFDDDVTTVKEGEMLPEKQVERLIP